MKNQSVTTILSTVSVAFLCNFSAASAQDVYQTKIGQLSTWYGHGAAILGDLNSDGFDEYAVGEDYDDTVAANAGRAMIYSGKTGATLHTLYGAAADDRFGSQIICVNDVNSDEIGRAHV